jgi:hypothetical protein
MVFGERLDAARCSMKSRKQTRRFDFSKIDTVFANAEKNGKWVELILIPGFGTPA